MFLLCCSQINVNGLLSFETEVPVFNSDLILPTQEIKLIAPFYADVDTRLSGNVYYRWVPTFRVKRRKKTRFPQSGKKSGKTFFPR